MRSISKLIPKLRHANLRSEAYGEGYQLPNQEPTGEAGQSLVLIALVFVILLAFVGLAVDAGFAFMRSSQFSAAVDAASMAGVVDLEPGGTSTSAADLRAEQFLAANGWPTDTITLFDSARSIAVSGIPQYSITVTWPVEFFFAKVIGLESLIITHEATAAFYAQSELYTPTARDGGQIRKAPQFIFGREGCTVEGDPVSPLQSGDGSPNTDHSLYEGVYHYQIKIPRSYSHTHVLVQLFDPDDYNVQGDSATIIHSDVVSGTLPTDLSCTSGGMGDRCIIDTLEQLNSSLQNPFWLQRADENWDTSCSQNFGTGSGNAITTFELYYTDNDVEVPLGSYTADGSHYTDTDLNWVSPGVTETVPFVAADTGSFKVPVGLLPADADGTKFIELNVTSSGGSSKNVWDIWAGPMPSFYVGRGLPALESNVNLRNLQIANRPGAYTTEGLTVAAIGRMPLDHYAAEELTFDLVPLDITAGEGTIYATIFGLNGGVTAPRFEIDSVSTAEFNMCTEVFVPATLGHTGSCSVTGWDPLEADCNGTTSCSNAWTRPQYAMGIPGNNTGYAGGTLQAFYNPDNDSHTWSVAITAGRPFLTR